MRDAKAQLATKMEELEVERQTLNEQREQQQLQLQSQQGLQQGHLAAEIEEFLREDSELADGKRESTLAEGHVEAGGKVTICLINLHCPDL